MAMSAVRASQHAHASVGHGTQKRVTNLANALNLGGSRALPCVLLPPIARSDSGQNMSRLRPVRSRFFWRS